VDAWLREARDKLAAEAGADPSEYELSQGEIDQLLELARIAAHASGERINAPLLCYLVGLAHGRRGGELNELIDAAVATSA
jgi:hypothetical protein